LVRTTVFERLLDALDHPTVVVTAASRRRGPGHAPAGCVAAFPAQCSVDPPRYCVFLPKDHPVYDVARRAQHLMVHFLDHRQGGLAACFDDWSGDAASSPAGAVRWSPGPDGRTPRLADVDAWLFGRVTARLETGDHVGFVLDPVRAKVPRRLRLLRRDG
jgi:flavin reductase (DIM6/NTAB) family NADH-FMN oxidoreductase RutF